MEKNSERKYQERKADRLQAVTSIFAGLNFVVLVSFFNFVDNFREKRDGYADSVGARVLKQSQSELEIERNSRIEYDHELQRKYEALNQTFIGHLGGSKHGVQ